MKRSLAVTVLLTAAAPIFAHSATESSFTITSAEAPPAKKSAPEKSAPGKGAPEKVVPEKALPEKTQFDAYADRQRAEMHSFIEAAKEELDRLEKRETVRLETVAKRIESEPFADADKAKIRSLQELMSSSSADTRGRALRDLQDKLRTEKLKAIWAKYKAKKAAVWDKLAQGWETLLTQPPLMIRKTAQVPETRRPTRSSSRR